MEQLHNGYTLVFPRGVFPLSTDSMALADFVRLPANAKVLDLGSGCGQLGHLLCAKDSRCHVTGIELEEGAHLAALENIRENALQSRMTAICRDLREIPEFLEPGSFDICVSNPPYFAAGPASRSVPLARREDLCTLEELLRSASWALKYGGDLYLVHRPERLAQICAAASGVRLEAKRLHLLRHRPDAPISLVLLQLRKGAKPGLILEECCLHNADGSPSDSYKQIYHL